MSTLTNTVRKFALMLTLAAPAAFTQDLAPDVLIKSVSQDVIATLKQDRDLRVGNRSKIVELVEAKIVPHFDFTRITRIAMATNWRRATPEQQERLVKEFQTLLVRTYSGALASYRDQVIEVKSARVQPSGSEVTVRSEVKQSGAESISVDYDMAKTASGWKVYDVRIGGVSLVTTYRDTFAQEVRNNGIDGLINLLAGKNRQNDVKPAA